MPRYVCLLFFRDKRLTGIEQADTDRQMDSRGQHFELPLYDIRCGAERTFSLRLELTSRFIFKKYLLRLSKMQDFKHKNFPFFPTVS